MLCKVFVMSYINRTLMHAKNIKTICGTDSERQCTVLLMKLLTIYISSGIPIALL